MMDMVIPIHADLDQLAAENIIPARKSANSTLITKRKNVCGNSWTAPARKTKKFVLRKMYTLQ